MSALHESIELDFTAARGEAEDGSWAEAALSRLLLDEVRSGVAESAVRDLLPIVVDSDESARELFGDPRAWAEAQQESWIEDGQDVKVRPEPSSPRQLVVSSLVGAAVFTTMLVIVSVVTADFTLPYSPALVLVPLLLSIATVATGEVYQRVKARRSFRSGVLAGFGLIVAATGAIVAFLFTLRDDVFVEGSVVWQLALALGWAMAAWAVGRVWLGVETAEPPVRAQSDEDWFEALAAELRRRDDMTDTRVADIVEEARAHLAESGESAAVEFGSPREHAHRFPRDRRVSARRTAYFWTALTLLPLGLLVGDLVRGGWAWAAFDLWTAAWAGVIGLRAALAWRSVARAGRG